jgi:NAD(P)-dependent dehydrogenase (short-subunit alcohol dehydrogenase family)
VAGVGDIVLKPLKRATPADFAACFNLHVIGAAEAVKSVEPMLKKTGGSVVLFSSVAVSQGFTNHAGTPSPYERLPQDHCRRRCSCCSDSCVRVPLVQSSRVRRALSKA